MLNNFKKTTEYIGIDIGDKYLKIGVVKKKKDFCYLESYEKYDISKVIENSKIKDIEFVKDIIREYIKNNKVNTKMAIVSIPHKGYNYSITRIFEINKLSKQELNKAIKIEIEDRIPIKNEDDYESFWSVVEETAEKQRIMVSVVSKEVLQNYKELFSQLGLHAIMQPKSISLLNNLPKDEEINLIIDIGHTSTDFIISKGRIPLMIKTSNIAGHTFNELISNMMAITYDEAEKLKNTTAAIVKDREDLATSDEQLQLSYLLSGQVDLIVSEIKKSIFIASSELKVKINNVYITGGTSNLKLLPEYISRQISNEVEKDVMILTPWYLKDNQDENIKTEISYFASVFGSSYQAYDDPVVSMNFSQESVTKNNKSKLIITGISSLAILLIFNAFLIINISILNKTLTKTTAEYNTVNSENKTIQSQYDSLLSQFNSVQGQLDKNSQYKDTLENIIKNKIDYSSYNKIIKTCIPQNIQIDGINFDKTNVTIKGTSGNYSDIGYFVKELQNRPEFKEIDFKYEQSGKDKDTYFIRYMTFTITFKISK